MPETKLRQGPAAKTRLAICCKADECEKAGGCEKGRPHAVNGSCDEASICHDIRPCVEGGVRVWCDLLDAEANAGEATPVKAVEAEPQGATPVRSALQETHRVFMFMGAVKRGESMRRRWEFEDYVALREIKRSGAYLDIFPKGMFADGPWDAFCHEMGLRRQTVDEKIAVLDKLGEEALRVALKDGFPHTGLRALLAAPEELRRELNAKGKEVTVEDLRDVLDRVEATNARADRERERADRERSRADKAEHEALKRAKQAADLGAEAKDLKAELAAVREGKLVTNEADVRRNLELAWKAAGQIEGLLNCIDPRTDEPTAAKVAVAMFEIAVRLRDKARNIDEMLGD